MSDTNHPIDPPADVTQPEPVIDADALIDWSQSPRWWDDLPDIFAEEADEDAFHQALRITVTSNR
jgi:hypothetical protein